MPFPPRAEEVRLPHPGAAGGREPPPATPGLHTGLHTTTAVSSSRLRAGVRTVIGRAPGPMPGGRRVRAPPGAFALRSSVNSVLALSRPQRSVNRTREVAMSYLLQYARRPDSIARATRRPASTSTHRLNRPGFYGDAFVRVFVEHTTSPASPAARPAARAADRRLRATRSTSSSRSRRPSCARTRSSRSTRCSSATPLP